MCGTGTRRHLLRTNSRVSPSSDSPGPDQRSSRHQDPSHSPGLTRTVPTGTRSVNEEGGLLGPDLSRFQGKTRPPHVNDEVLWRRRGDGEIPHSLPKSSRGAS